MTTEECRFTNRLIEMICAHLCDRGVDFSDYAEALQAFYTYIARTGLRQAIIFTDHYPASDVSQSTDTVRIYDPVNSLNNVARLYGDKEAAAIVDAALDAGDAIDAALEAPTKGLTVNYWQKVFGTAFQG